MEKYTIESELAIAICRFSYGRISMEKAKELAKEYAPVLEDTAALEHKSIGYYAKQIVSFA